jgi:hypothetical protein
MDSTEGSIVGCHLLIEHNVRLYLISAISGGDAAPVNTQQTDCCVIAAGFDSEDGDRGH